MSLIDQNAVETILRESRHPFSLSGGAEYGTLIAVPDGWTIETDEQLEQLQDHPFRKRGQVATKTVESFAHYVNTHKRQESLLYAAVEHSSSTPLKLTAVFNEHAGTVHEEPRPGWRDFTATLTPDVSHEWKTWTGASGKPMSQLEFAIFLEDNIKDISSQDNFPTGTDMLRMATQFEATQDKQFRSAIRLQSGGVNLECIDTDDAATVEKMKAFDRFMIGIPAFWKGQAYLLEAKLRYRTQGGKLTLWYDLIRPDLVITDAVDNILEQVEKATELPILYGAIVK